MKRLHLLCFLCVSWLAPGQLYIGPTVGLKGSTISFFDGVAKDAFKGQPAFGFDAGIMVSRRIKDRFLLNAELNYSQKGKYVKGKTEPYTYVYNGKTFTADPDPHYRNRQTNHFIELPIYYLLEFKNTVGKDPGMSGNQKSYKWFIGAGPTISYWLGGNGSLISGDLQENNIDKLNYKITFNQNNDSLNQITDANVMNVTTGNRFQFSINFTGGIALEPVGFQKIIIAAHLELGQSFLAKTNPGYFPGSPNDQDVLRSKYYSLRLSVGYLFDTKIENRQRGKSTNKQSNKSRKKTIKKRR